MLDGLSTVLEHLRAPKLVEENYMFHRRALPFPPHLRCDAAHVH